MTRIVVVLPNWFGETLFTTPFLSALRRQRPESFIATLGWPQCREVLLHHPAVDELVAYDERGRHRSLAGKWRLVATLRGFRFDAAFILRKSLSRSLLLALAGIPERIGFDHPKSGWLLTRRVPMPEGPMHKSATYLRLLDAAAPVGPYHYTVSDEERRQARERMRAERLDDGRPLIVLHPGANWPHKRWAPERFAALGDRLAEAAHARIALTGGPDDSALADAIQARMRHPAVLWAGQTTLRELGARLEQAQLLVSNDTGVLHIAAALGRPVVALFGPTAPSFTGPLGAPERTTVLHHPDCCPQIPCRAPDRPPHPGMDSISVEEACAAAVSLLAQPA